jgi:hypothetical protein
MKTPWAASSAVFIFSCSRSKGMAKCYPIFPCSASGCEIKAGCRRVGEPSQLGFSLLDSSYFISGNRFHTLLTML